MSRRRRLLWRGLGCVLIAVALGSLTAIGLSASWLDGFQARAADAVQPRGTATDVVVVGIDARSIDAQGTPWPWPRSIHADLLARVAAAQPRSIAYDVVCAPAGPGDDQLAAAAAS